MISRVASARFVRLDVEGVRFFGGEMGFFLKSFKINGRIIDPAISRVPAQIWDVGYDVFIMLICGLRMD